MATAVGAYGVTSQYVVMGFSSIPQEESKSFFQTTKEAIVRFWAAFVTGLRAGWDGISFVFFRFLELIHPSLGPKIENIALRLTNVWQSMKEAWKMEEVRTQMDQLQMQNRELELRVQSYDQMSDTNDRLTRENERLTQAPFLKCGILAHGFARAHCQGCGHDFLIAFSCKGRGICPSCNTRHMAQIAAHLVDHVFPKVPVRQWVLSLPKRLRYFLHHHHEYISPVLNILISAVESQLIQSSSNCSNLPDGCRVRLCDILAAIR